MIFRTSVLFRKERATSLYDSFPINSLMECVCVVVFILLFHGRVAWSRPGCVDAIPKRSPTLWGVSSVFVSFVSVSFVSFGLFLSWDISYLLPQPVDLFLLPLTFFKELFTALPCLLAPPALV